MKKALILITLLTKLLTADTMWQGTIGKSKIYLSLPCDPSVKNDKKCSTASKYFFYGHYFYASSLQNIILSKVFVTKNNLAYKIQVINQGKIEEEFDLTYKNQQFKGFWSHNGKKLLVKLKKIKKIEDEIKEKHLAFKRLKVEKIKSLKKELVWIEEKHTNLKMFRLGNGFNAKVRNKLNPLFDKMQTEEALAILGCSDGAYNRGMSANDYQVVYLSNDILSLSHSASWYCDGLAHPSFGTSYKVFDLHSGKKYELEDLVTFAKKVPKKSDEYNEKWYHYTDVIRAKKLRELAFKAQNKPLKAMPSPDTYDPYDLTHWSSEDWVYTSKGIEIFLNFCEADRCFRGDSFLIPFSLLAPYKNKAFPYEFKR